MIRKNANSAFTLIELLVVISIVAVLASVVLASTANAKRRAQDAQIISQKNQVKNALELYASTNGGYPNPTPGTKSLWCIGGNGCSFYSNGTQYAVINKLPGLPIRDFTLPTITEGAGYDQGIIYESCVSSDPVCPSATITDITNPDTSNAAQLLSSTYGSGDDQTFVGIWEDIFDPYEPGEEALASIQSTVSIEKVGDIGTYFYITWTTQNVISCTLGNDLIQLISEQGGSSGPYNLDPSTMTFGGTVTGHHEGTSKYYDITCTTPTSGTIGDSVTVD